MTEIGVKTEVISGRSLICLYFQYDPVIVSRLKNIDGSHWHSGLRCWVTDNTDENRKKLKSIFRKDTTCFLYSVQDRIKMKTGSERPVSLLANLDETDIEKIEQFRRWMSFRRYSVSTIRTYTEMVQVFLRFIKPENAGWPLGDNIQRFTNEYIIPNSLSYSYQNQLVNALKLFYREIMRQEVARMQLQRPRQVYKLPNVLNKNEVKRLLQGIRNIKHRAMLSTVYGCGLRRGELLNLKPQDIDRERGLLVVRLGKGNKDRVVPISDKNILLLEDYYRQYRPVTWLFEGIKKGEQYDERSLQQVLKKAIGVAGIKKPVTLHWLRHSYATHLHESGVDIRYIQEILGHKSTRTTEIYTHVSNRSIQLIRSPLDDL